VLIIDAGSGFNEAEAGESAVLEIVEIGSQGSNVVGIDAEIVRRITDNTGWLGGTGAGGVT
jgi:hypothetical protein